MAEWTFLTNHAIVLLHIAANPGARLRDIAAAAGITERAVQQIVRDLGDAGYLTATRVGRRNQYTVHRSRPMRHPSYRQHQVGELIALLGRTAPGEQ